MAAVAQADIVRNGRTFQIATRERGGLRISTQLAVTAASPPLSPGALPVPYRAPFGVPSPAPLTLRARTAGDRRGVSLGMNRDFRTGDRHFDDLVYVESDAPAAHLEATLASPAVRAALAEGITARGATVTLAEDGSLTARFAKTSAADASDPLVRPLMTWFEGIVQGLPTFVPGKRPLAGTVAEWTLIVTLLGSMGVCFAALFPLVRYELLDNDLALVSLAAGAVGAVATWPVLALLSRGRASGWNTFRAYAFFSLLGGLAGSFGIARVINCAFDDQPSKTHLVEVVSVQTVNTKSGTSYLAVVRSWRPGESTLKLKVGSSTASYARTSKRVLVTTRPGVLGAEWAVGVAAAPR